MKTYHPLSNYRFYYWLLVPLLFLPQIIQAQSAPSKEKALLRRVQNAKTDTARYTALYQLVLHHQNGDPDLAKRYNYQLIDVANATKDPYRRARSWLVLSGIFFLTAETDSTAITAQRVLDIIGDSQEAGMLQMKSEALLNLGSNSYREGKIVAAVELLDSALATPQLSVYNAIRIRNNLSVLLNETGDYDDALEYGREVWEYGLANNDQALVATALGNMANIHCSIRDYERAIELHRQALALRRAMRTPEEVLNTYYSIATVFYEKGQPDSCYFYSNKLLRDSKKPERPYWTFRALYLLILTAQKATIQNIGSYLEQAEQMLNYSQALTEIDRYDLQIAMAEYYHYDQQYPLAISYARNGLEGIRQLDPDTSLLWSNGLLVLSEAQYKAGDYQAAWITQRALTEVNKVLNNRNQAIATANTAVELELTQNQLARQKAEQKTLLEQQASASRTKLFALLLGLIGVILAIMYLAYRRAQRDKKIIIQQNAVVQQSLQEKETLLREIHHRVKNNLQIISALLDKQARQSSNEAVQRLIREGQERIRSMALIHQNLYQSKDLNHVDIKSYLQELSRNIERSQSRSGQEISLELRIVEEKLDIDRAIPVGLVLNELLTNAYKYAFRDGRTGKITIDFYKQGEEHLLCVKDNGVGLPSDVHLRGSQSLGLNLVQGLVRQLDGALEWPSTQEGTTVLIRF